MSQMVYRPQPRNRKLWLATAMVAACAVIILLLGLPVVATAAPTAAPVAAPDNYATNEYLPLTVLTATGVLANDTDADMDVLTATLDTAPAAGMLDLAADGSFVYTPTVGATGGITFTYVATDGVSTSASTLVTISVAAVPLPDTTIPTATITHTVNISFGQRFTVSNASTLSKISGPAWLNATAPYRLVGSVGSGGSTDVAFDSVGNLYFTQSGGHRVYKIAPDGTQTVFAGTGSAGSTGDGGLATDATFEFPSAIAVDSADNVYVTDAGDHRIRKIDAVTGIISNFAGTGSQFNGGNGGLAIDAGLGRYAIGLAIDSADNVYVSLEIDNQVRRIDAQTGIITRYAGTGFVGLSGDGGPADVAKLNRPAGLVFDSQDNLYIADSFNLVIRKVDPSGTISTFAGGGANQHGGGPATDANIFPYGVAVDADDNLLIAATSTGYVFSVDSSNTITPVAGNGATSGAFVVDGDPALQARFSSLGNIAVAEDGRIYLTGNSVRVLTPVIDAAGLPTRPDLGSNQFVYAAGNAYGASTTHTLTVNVINTPPVAVPDAYDTNEYAVLAVLAEDGVLANDSDANGDALAATLVTAPAGGMLDLAADGSFTYTSSIGTTGAITFTYVATDGVDATIATLVTLTVAAVPTATITTSVGITFEKAFTLSNATTVSITNGAPWLQVAPPAPPTIDAIGSGYASPYDVAVDSAGNLYVADRDNHRILKIAPDGTQSVFAGTGSSGFSGDGGLATAAALNSPTAVAVDSADNVYVGDASNRRVRKIDAVTGIITTFAGDGGAYYSGDGSVAATAGIGYFLNGLAIDSADNVYISADTTHVVLKVDALTGLVTTFAGTEFSSGFSGDGGAATAAQLNGPKGLGFDAADNLYIADISNQRVRKVDTAGNISTVAGNGGYGFSGDGGVATDATFRSPWDVAVDADGNILIVDTFNNRVRRVDISGIITTFAGSGDYYGDVGNGGLAADASLQYPRGIVVAADGRVFLADTNRNLVRVITPAPPSVTGTPTRADIGINLFALELKNKSGVTTHYPLTINVVNDAPMVVADAYSTAEDTSLVIAASGVLANDSDINGDVFTPTIVTAATDGTVVLAADGSFVYTPTLNFNGTITFTYKTNDGLSDSDNAATVTVTVNPVNDIPVATGESYTTIEDTYLVVYDPGTGGDGRATISSEEIGIRFGVEAAVLAAQRSAAGEGRAIVSVVGLLANDTDIEGTTLSAVVADLPANGYVAINPNGTFFYAPAIGFTGVDTFTYQATDGDLISLPVVVSVTVTATAAPPMIFVDGWNLFGFPWQTDTITNALAPLTGSYNIVWGYEEVSDTWQVFDVDRVGTAFEVLNDLTHLYYGEGYWIHITQPITVTGSGGRAMGASRGSSVNPPMQVYGYATVAGLAVTAEVNGVLCAEGVSAEINGLTLYALTLPDSCAGTISLSIDGATSQTTTWDNRASQQIDLVNTPTAVAASGLAVNPQPWIAIVLLSVVLLTGLSVVTLKRLNYLK